VTETFTTTFTTTDGVDLGLVRWGPDPAASQAPPLLLVHGGVTAYQCFEPIVPALSADRHVVAYDRRGRGISGDGKGAYTLAREVEDLVEVARHVGDGGPVDVLGYSYGGMIALHALESDALRRLVVYEPPFAVRGIPADGTDELLAVLDKGDIDAALRLFITLTFHLPDSVVNAMERHPMWQVSRDTAPTIEREFDALERTVIPTAARPDLPVLVLVASVGGNPAFRDIAARLEASLPDVTVAHVGGIPHFAISTDADTFVRHVTSFLA